MQPITRDAIPGDRDALFRINRDCLSGVSEFDGEYFEQLVRESALFRTVEVGEEIAGYVCALTRGATYDGEEFHWFREHLDRDFLYIDQVAISQHRRGKGLGRMLYKDLEMYASRNGINTLACEVNYEPPNEQSQAFHRRCGFTEIGRMKTRGLVVSLLTKNVISSGRLHPTGEGKR